MSATTKMYDAVQRGEWEGRTPEELICEWTNCRHAELHENGSIYIEDPQSGHYLDEQHTADFVAFCRANGVEWEN